MKKTTQKNNKKIEVCYVLSYKSPSYTRTATLLAALRQLPEVELTIIKNKKTGIVRYWQTLSQLVKYRLHHKPDVFIVGFRGQEVFWLFYPFMRGSRIIFDEFINMPDWFIYEHKKIKKDSVLAQILLGYMRWIAAKSDYLLADTPAHAKLSTDMYKVPPNKVKAIPVGAEEEVFKPLKKVKRGTGNFKIFFYGNMLPLHGLDVILDCITRLQDTGEIKGVHFTLVGGRGRPEMADKIRNFITVHHLHEYVTYIEWLEYKKLPQYIVEADLCLGGPFGGTGQARRVVTGKTFQFLAMGAPTVIGETSNQGMFTHKKNCLISRQKDPTNLAEVIVWAKKHRKQLKTIGEQGRKLYESKFSSARIANSLLQLVSKLSKRGVQ